MSSASHVTEKEIVVEKDETEFLWDRESVWFPVLVDADMTETERKDAFLDQLYWAKLALSLASEGRLRDALPDWTILDPLLKKLFPDSSYAKKSLLWTRSNPLLQRALIAYGDVDSAPILFSVRKLKPKPGTQFWWDNQKKWYENVNAAFRRIIPYGSPKDDLEFLSLSLPQIHDIIQKGILLAPPNNKPMTLFRAQADYRPWDENKEIQSGQLLVLETIWSTSLKVAAGYLTKSPTSWCCLFVIRVPALFPTLLIDPDTFLEVLLPAKSILRVDSVVATKINIPYERQTTIDLHVVYVSVLKTHFTPQSNLKR